MTRESVAVPGWEKTYVTFNFEPTRVICSFDGGEPENCSFPLYFSISQFGLSQHTVEVTVFDVSGKSLTLTANFRLADREFQYRCARYTKLGV